MAGKGKCQKEKVQPATSLLTKKHSGCPKRSYFKNFLVKKN